MSNSTAKQWRPLDRETEVYPRPSVPKECSENATDHHGRLCVGLTSDGVAFLCEKHLKDRAVRARGFPYVKREWIYTDLSGTNL